MRMSSHLVAVEKDGSTIAQLSPSTSQTHALLAEYLLVREPLNGVYILPKASNPREWTGCVFVRKGIYQGGIFRFNIAVPIDWPNTRLLPKIVFDAPLFHPSVHATTRQLAINKFFPDGWQRDTHHLYHAIACVQRIFYKLDTLARVNEEAVKLYANDREAFRKKVEECIKQSRSVVYDAPLSTDANAIQFTPWDAQVHEPMRASMLTSQQEEEEEALTERFEPSSPPPATPRLRHANHSWVDKEAFTILAKQ